MSEYKIYALAHDGHVSQAPQVIHCDDDRTAIDKANLLLDDKQLEVWNAGRKIACLKPDRRHPGRQQRDGSSPFSSHY
jgi:hypothetical protein